MNLFAVFKEGVYRHECGGIFDSLAKAEEARTRLIEWEPDSYHEFAIVPFTLNEITELGGYKGELLEHDKLSIISKPTTNTN